MTTAMADARSMATAWDPPELSAEEVAQTQRAVYVTGGTPRMSVLAKSSCAGEGRVCGG